MIRVSEFVGSGNRMPAWFKWVACLYKIMALSIIDSSERGFYAVSSKCPYASRYDVARYKSFYVVSLGNNRYSVRRVGGSTHYVKVCLWQGRPVADCDCADWLQFGASYRRPCIHIWRIWRLFALGVC